MNTEIKVGDRVKHINGSKPEGVVKSIYQPVATNELWADVLWLGSTLGNVVHHARKARDQRKHMRLSALKLVQP